MLYPIWSLIEEWGAEAAKQRRRGWIDLASGTESYAEELQTALYRSLTHEVVIEDGAEITGYTTTRFNQMIRDAQLTVRETDEGRLVRLIDLPVKAGRLSLLLGSPGMPMLDTVQSADLNRRRKIVRALR